MKSRAAPTVAPRGSPSRPTGPSQGTKPPQTRVRSTGETRYRPHSPILTTRTPVAALVKAARNDARRPDEGLF